VVGFGLADERLSKPRGRTERVKIGPSRTSHPLPAQNALRP
jgi:hypothetical protein